MRVFILGGSGRTGVEFIKLGLQKGWEIVAGARDPSKLQDVEDDSSDNQLKVETVDIYSSLSMAPVMVGCDIVVSCLGATGISRFLPCTYISIYSESITPILNAMKAAGVDRLMVLTSVCTEYHPGNPKMMEWVIKPLLVGRILADMARMERILADSVTEIKYTSVRPPAFTDGPTTGSVVAVEGQFHPDAIPAISRKDTAQWMVDNISNSEWSRTCVAIGVRRT